MLISSELDLNAMCRTCLSIGEMKSIYEISSELSFADMLMVCTSVKYYPEAENLPSQICDDCITEIKRSYKFAVKCRKSEDKLQNYLQNILNAKANFFKNETEHTQQLDENSPEIDYKLSESHSETTPTIRIRNDLNGPTPNEQDRTSNETITSQNRTIIWLKNEIDDSLPINQLKCNIKLENDSEIENSSQDIFGTIFGEIENNQNNNSFNEQSRISTKTNCLKNDLNSKETKKTRNDPTTCRLTKNLQTITSQNEDSKSSSFRNGDKHIYKLRKTNTPLQSYTEYDDRHSESSSKNSESLSSDDDHSEQSNCANNKLYACTRCNRSYKLEKNLITHTKQHTEELVACNICGDMFAFGSALKFHMATHAEVQKKRHKCQVCDYPFHTLNDLNEHVKLHTSANVLSCSFCGDTFQELKTLKIHMQSHDDERPYSCSKCDRKFANKSYLASHQKVHTDIKRHKCTVCGHQFRKSTNLKAHMAIHTNAKSRSCSICDKSFSINYKLDVHMRTHTKEKPFSCIICNHTFSSKPQLTQHISTHSGQSFVCSICGKNFMVYEHLRNHLLIHTDERKHACTICDSSYKTKRSLYKHSQNKHPKGDPVSCAICSRSFINKERLQRHIQIHNDDKPFACSVCGKSFRGKASLKQHMPTHSNERTHCCTICDKAFKFTSNLNLHMKTHKDDRPFACTLCDYTFKLQHHLKAHLKNKHPTKN